VAGFGAGEHIRKRSDFERAYKGGTRLTSRLMTVFFVATELDGPRLGLAATRKLGSAVVRNRARRLVREVFRHHKPTGAMDVVVVPRREMLDVPYRTLEAEFLSLLDRYQQRRHQPAPAAREQGGTRRDSRV
jgi:ribonuclease P protein component